MILIHNEAVSYAAPNEPRICFTSEVLSRSFECLQSGSAKWRMILQYRSVGSITLTYHMYMYISLTLVLSMWHRHTDWSGVSEEEQIHAAH